IYQKLGSVQFNELDSFVNALPDNFREEAIKRFAYERVQEFPEGLLNYLQTRSEGDYSEEIQRAVSHWAGQDPTRAAEWVADLDAGQQKDLAARNLAHAWARADP